MFNLGYGFGSSISLYNICIDFCFASVSFFCWIWIVSIFVSFRFHFFCWIWISLFEVSYFSPVLDRIDCLGDQTDPDSDFHLFGKKIGQ